MLSKFIKNIRSKPESVRRGITLSVSLGVTGVIAFFWFISYLNYSAAVLSAKPIEASPTTFFNKVTSLIGESYANVRSTMVDDSSFVSGTTTVDGVSTTAVSTSINTETGTTTSSSTAPAQSPRESLTEASSTSTQDVPQSTSGNNSVDLQDILNTKNRDNQ